MSLVASTGSVLVRFWQHWTSKARYWHITACLWGVNMVWSRDIVTQITREIPKKQYTSCLGVCVLLKQHLITYRSNISVLWGLNDFKIWADLVRSVWLPHNDALMSIAFLDFLRVFVHGPTFWILYVWFDHFDLPFAFYVFNGLITLGRANCVATDSVASLLESGNSKL